MHVAIVTRALDAMGGIQTHIRDLSLQLLAEGRQVSVITGSTGLLSDQLEQAGVNIRVCPELDYLRDGNRLFHLARYALPALKLPFTLQELSPNIVHSHGPTHIHGRLASRIMGLPTVNTVHGWPYAKEDIDTKTRLIKIAFKAAEFLGNGRIICVSEADRQYGIETGHITHDTSSTVYNGVPDIPFSLRKQFSELNSDEPVKLIMVARLSRPQKDHISTLKALAGLTHLNWTIDFAGKGDPQEYKALAQELGIADRCNFLGEVKDVEKRLATKDVFVLTSLFEGLPIAIIEAMRAGLPVIANDVGGNAELVREGVNGHLLHPGDVEGLRGALESLITDPEKRQAMGEAGRRHYETRFTVSQMVQNMTAIYERTLKTHSTRFGRPGFLRPASARLEHNPM